MDSQSPGDLPSADWYPDPCTRHELRYWDGAAWTHHVADSGQTSVDPVDAPPAVDEEAYVRSCSEAAFSDEKEERTFRSDPAFQLVLDSFNSQRYPAAIKAAEDLLPRFADFDWPYNLLGSAYRATDQLQQSREVFGRGLSDAKRKVFLLTGMGETLWRLGDLHQTVYYWCQAVHCLSSNPVDYNAYLLLSYVAKGCGLGDIEQRLLGRVDAMQGGQPRLDPTTANRLTELVRSRKDHAIGRALQDLDAKHLQAAGAGAQPGKDDRNPAYERQLKEQFGVDYGEGGWGFEGGKTADMATELAVPDVCLGVLRNIAKELRFDKVCVVAGGKMTVLVCNTRPAPICLISGLDTSGVAEFIALSIKERGKQVTAYRGTWVLEL